MTTTLLVVDDEPSILETMRYILEAEGYRVLTASNGEEALEVIRRELPPIVLLDVMMPKLSGFEVCKRLRRDPAIAGIYVLILTARGQKADEALAIEAGADAYIRKPFDDDEVLRHLEAVLAARRPQT